MSVYEKARDLAEEVLETKEAKKFLEMKYIVDGDFEANQKLDNYAKLQSIIKARKSRFTKEELDEKLKELEQASNEIENDSLLTEYFSAEKKFNSFVNSIIDIFNATLLGEFADDEEEPKGGCCGGGCGGCSGC